MGKRDRGLMKPEVTCLEWETAEQSEKGIVGSGNRKSRVLEWETADQVEKRNRGLRKPEVTCFEMGNR